MELPKDNCEDIFKGILENVVGNTLENAKAEDPPSDARREQGAPKEELPKPDSHQNKFAEAIDASMAGEETLQTVTKSAETGEEPLQRSCQMGAAKAEEPPRSRQTAAPRWVITPAGPRLAT